MSTGNVFDLPLHYQYGVGSAGFLHGVSWQYNDK
jgi:hypothetical protein